MTKPVLKYVYPSFSNLPTLSFLLTGLLVYLISGTVLAQPKDGKPIQTIIGWIEPVLLDSFSQAIDAKIDSGADHSSLHATEIRFFDRESTTWVRFRSAQGQVLNQPLVRTATIKRKDAPAEKRPVVLMRFCLGGQWLDATVNLVDRTRFRQPMLIGRSALPEGILIDPNRTHLTRPQCNLEKTEKEKLNAP